MLTSCALPAELRSPCEAFLPQLPRALVRERRGPLLARGRGLEQTLDEGVPKLKAVGVNHLRVQVSMFADSREQAEPVVRALVKRLTTFG